MSEWGLTALRFGMTNLFNGFETHLPRLGCLAQNVLKLCHFYNFVKCLVAGESFCVIVLRNR